MTAIPANTSREREILREAAGQAGLLIEDRAAGQLVGWNGDLLAVLGRFVILAECRLAEEEK